MLKRFTICLPSNRPLASAMASIDSAIAFAGANGGTVVISDNSGDPKKSAFYETVPSHVIYKVANGFSAVNNLLNTLQHANTGFILPMGDDDLVRQKDDCPLFDFDGLDESYVGVKPETEVFAVNQGILKTQLFSLTQDNPFDRMLAYCREADGDNSAYYSYYRRDLFEALVRFIATDHPTRGGYIDWSLVLSLISMGKMAQDPSTVFSYNAGAWIDKAGIDSARSALFLNAGLPDIATKFEPLFNFLDCFAFVSIRNSPNSDMQKGQARQAAAVIFLRDFLTKVEDDPQDYTDFLPLISALISESRSKNTSPEQLVPHALMILEKIKPGLAEAYGNFLARAVG